MAITKRKCLLTYFLPSPTPPLRMPQAHPQASHLVPPALDAHTANNIGHVRYSPLLKLPAPPAGNSHSLSPPSTHTPHRASRSSSHTNIQLTFHPICSLCRTTTNISHVSHSAPFHLPPLPISSSHAYSPFVYTFYTVSLTFATTPVYSSPPILSALGV